MTMNAVGEKMIHIQDISVMGRDFSYSINNSEEEELFQYRNTVEWMCQRRFTYEELRQYIIECLTSDNIRPVAPMSHVLNEMNPEDVATISSC